jgi:hypothetical protein
LHILFFSGTGCAGAYCGGGATCAGVYCCGGVATVFTGVTVAVTTVTGVPHPVQNLLPCVSIFLHFVQEFIFLFFRFFI